MIKDIFKVIYKHKIVIAMLLMMIAVGFIGSVETNRISIAEGFFKSLSCVIGSAVLIKL